MRLKLSSIMGCSLLLICSLAFAQDTAAQGDFRPTYPIPKTVNVGLGLTPFSSGAQLAEPESGEIQHSAYVNQYFDLSYTLPQNWIEGAKGPPPSATGYYVLSQLRTASDAPSRATIMISASDMFFLLHPAGSPMELLQQSQRALPDVMKVERASTEVRIGSHAFARLDYTGAEIHWVTLATEFRCHTLQFVFAGRDPEYLEKLVQGLVGLKLPGEGDQDREFPVCIKDYANDANLLRRVDPILVGPKYTTVPVRMIVGKDGKVEHIHVITAFPEQARSISDALAQWTFKPYLQNGRPAEVETGLLFEFKPDGVKSANTPAEKVSQQ
jgi:Gram-negative bacterial TonB protein C-terminal